MSTSDRSGLWNLRKAVSPAAIHLPAAPTGSTTNQTMCYLCTRFTCNPSTRSDEKPEPVQAPVIFQPVRPQLAIWCRCTSRCGKGIEQPAASRPSLRLWVRSKRTAQ